MPNNEFYYFIIILYTLILILSFNRDRSVAIFGLKRGESIRSLSKRINPGKINKALAEESFYK